MTLRYDILGLLRGKGPQHGYALLKEFKRRTGADCHVGNFYRGVQKLVGAGYVRRVGNLDAQDARRIIYEITSAGSSAFDEWFWQIPPPRIDMTSDLALRAIFLPEVEPAAARRLLTRAQAELYGLSKRLEQDLGDVLTRAGGAPDLRATLLRSHLRRVAAEIELLHELALNFGLPVGDEGETEDPMEIASSPSTFDQKRRSGRGGI
jgi:DNA-binding PadR family transcriptional regulator